MNAQGREIIAIGLTEQLYAPYHVTDNINATI
ncbi:hypothetical protein CJA_2852 [Cellvibrio japonicus Ueda107]|uniref:Uncharacterized protein n=1 Tax=Cellvibrio japonicus (strain Ueda107) TaxID=498211 RepID=B3PC39_CELJU|nr:hypothetical protein CJA_2852 [Cellvibrio japonicus Ueda107]